MKKFATLLLAVLMGLSLVACSGGKKETLEEQSGEIVDEITDALTEEESEAEETFDSDLDDVMDEEESEASAEFEIPVQNDFVAVEGLGDKYVDFENRAFAYNGTVFKLGVNTLKDLIDAGIPFDEDDLNNKGNNLNSNYETSSYTVDINQYVTLQFRFINTTTEPMAEEDCLLSYVRMYYLYVPQPDYDASLNAEVTDCIFDAAKKVCFAFPLTLTKEQLLENSSEGAVQDDYNDVDYDIDSEVYMGDSGYSFEFDDDTNLMEEVTITWLP